MKNWRLSRFIIFAVTVLLFLVSLLFFISTTPTVRKQASALPTTALNGITHVLRKPYDWTVDLTEQFSNLFNTYNENQQLKYRLTQLENQEAMIAQLEEDNNNLRASLKIKEKFSASPTIPAKVLVRSSVSWLDFLVVDKGSRDGVTEGMFLIDEEGLVGTITQLNNDTTQIELLTNTANSHPVPVKITTGSKTIYGIMEGYDTEKQALKVSQLNSQDEIPVDSYVATSGLDGLSPSDIAVGQVLGLEIASDQSRIIYVKPKVDFSELKQLTLVGRQ